MNLKLTPAKLVQFVQSPLSKRKLKIRRRQSRRQDEQGLVLEVLRKFRELDLEVPKHYRQEGGGVALEVAS